MAWEPARSVVVKRLSMACMQFALGLETARVCVLGCVAVCLQALVRDWGISRQGHPFRCYCCRCLGLSDPRSRHGCAGYANDVLCIAKEQSICYRKEELLENSVFEILTLEKRARYLPPAKNSTTMGIIQ